MGEPFISEVRMMSFNYAPKGWATCDGQLLPINQNQPLFSLIGTYFGGDGRSTFALPNLQARTPIHVGNGHSIGQNGGEQTHTLTTAELPAHTHVLSGSSSTGNQKYPNFGNAGNVLAQDSRNAYGAPGNPAALNATSIATVGGGQAHPNMQPFLTINFSIALVGVYPSRN